MRTNPISDFFKFLTGPSYSEPDWLHYAYWLLALASLAVAISTWRLARPAARRAAVVERTANRPLTMDQLDMPAAERRFIGWRLGENRGVDILRFLIRFLLASFWWQQSLWKFPTDTGGLRYWTEQEVAHSAFKIQSHLIETVILPVFDPFAYAVYAFEVLVAVLLFLGLGVRVVASLGALLILSLFTGLYQADAEWPWSYVFLFVLMVVMVMDDYGMSLGLDAKLADRPRRV